MAKHIENIEIGSYRGLRSLKLTDFNHVNLLLGNNNAGKTSVLEVLESTQEPTSFANWKHVCRVNNQSDSPLYDAFLGIFPIDEEMHASYSFKHEGVCTKVDVFGEIDRIQVSEREIQRINGFIPTGNTKNKSLDWQRDVRNLRFKICVDNKEQVTYDIYDFLRKSPQDIETYEFYPTIRVKPLAGEYDNIYLNNILSNHTMYKKLIQALGVFDDSIEEIQGIVDAYGIEYRILSRKFNEAIPLNLYGDGIKKAIQLISAAVMAENGLLLVDEFETSIHASAMREIYRWLLTVSNELKVQLFLTTHSREAVELMLNLGEEYADGFNVHTLFRDGGKNKKRTLTAKEAKHAINEWGMDLR